MISLLSVTFRCFWAMSRLAMISSSEFSSISLEHFINWVKVIPRASARGPVIILELKVAKRFQELEAGCDAALEQIEQQNYAAYWENEGYTSITKYGICFYKKECMVKKFSH